MSAQWSRPSARKCNAYTEEILHCKQDLLYLGQIQSIVVDLAVLKLSLWLTTGARQVRGQVRTGRTDQTRTGEVKMGQVGTGQVRTRSSKKRSSQDTTSLDGSSQDRSSHIRTGQVKTGLVSTGQERLEFDTSSENCSK